MVRRAATLVVLCLSVMGLTAQSALAANVHFKKGSPVFTDKGLFLNATGSLTGLGNGDVVEAPRRKQAHRRVGDLASRALLLVLSETHALKCSLDYSRSNNSVTVRLREKSSEGSSSCSLA